MKKQIFGLLVTTRGFFNPILARTGRKRLIEKLRQMGHDVIVLGEEDTQYGVVRTYADAKKCADLFKANAGRIGGIIISAPNFGEETSTVEAIKLSGLNVPVLVHAFDDALDKMDLENRRDSFCGKISICANLRQYGIKFTDTTLHTCDVDDPLFERDISHFNGVCSVVGGLKGVRLAQMGARPAGFQTVRYSEKLLQDAGICVVPVDMSVMMKEAERLDDTAAIADKMAFIQRYGNISLKTSSGAIEKSARLTLAMEKYMDDNECAAGAIECWESIERNFGCATCLPMSIMGEAGRPIACETDVMGGLTMLALQLASGEPSGIMDWNNNYMDDRDKCVMIHCGNYPRSLFGRGFEISSLDIIGASVGYEKCFGACKGRVRPGTVSFARISTDDVSGKIRSYVGEGEFTDDALDTPGAPAVMQVTGMQKLMKHICMNGFEHHVAVNRSNSAEILKEALGKYMGWEVYRHIG